MDIEQPDLSPAEALAVLADGEMDEAHGLLPWGSNYTLLVTVCLQSTKVFAVYKPRRGERPLWDFPDGTLCRREAAAFVVSEGLGWGIVPPTVLRDGPYGIGSAQFFVPHDPERHYFTFDEAQQDQSRRIALFDLLINNADRKAGHCILDAKGLVWAIDHGICFHVQHKLRTVIWEFAGEQIADTLMADLRKYKTLIDSDAGRAPLLPLLAPVEINALCRRLDMLLSSGRYPEAGDGRSYPWPPV